jgi:hypothetical protein
MIDPGDEDNSLASYGGLPPAAREGGLSQIYELLRTNTRSAPQHGLEHVQ